MAMQTINPATGETTKTFQELDEKGIDAKLALAAKTFASYRQTPLKERARLLANAAKLLTDKAPQYGRMMAEEMGKPVGAGRAEAEKCARACSYYAEHGERFLQDLPVDMGKTKALVRTLPIGPVLAVMPWNFPFWQVIRFAAPALMLGNVGLLKHASNVPQCALALEELFLEAGFPKGAFQTLLIGSKAVSKVIEDPRIRAATITGSAAAGQNVASTAGKVLKKTVLELGGSDPFIVMPSAKLEDAAKVAVHARVINNGQSCIAAKRFIVHEQVYGEFERRFVERMKALKVGDPLDESTEIGPLATEQIRKDLEEQVNDAKEKGAKLLCGGKRREGKGWYYEPTAITDIPKSARVYREEVFGPAALLFKVKNIDEAVALANESEFGLGSSVWTNDAAEQERFIRDLDAGMTFVNAMVASDPRLPFGGVKESGYGRELGQEGLYEFANRKSVAFSPESDSRTE